MSVPYWVQDSIFYQIFPDRFANGDTSNDPPNVQKWGTPPTNWGFQGGDLQGIIQHMDYLLDLGITAIYLNPIFLATSNHRYNTMDYFTIDPKLGSKSDFKALLEAFHRNGLRIILDGVFNHVGRGFFAFVDILENGEHSAYKDWFHIKGYPLDAYGIVDNPKYLSWWNINSLPKLNTDNQRVREYIFNVARYWIQQGIDGWRLDVPNEIDDDSFWEEFQHAVRSVNKEAYLLGEIWTIDPRWTDGRHFDGLMNYPVKDCLAAFLSGREDAVKFKEHIDTIITAYDPNSLRAMAVPLDSHDTERFKTVLDGNVEKLKLAFLFQMAFPGAPMIYYGDEIGLEGGKDPDSRRAFPWKEADWNIGLRNWIKMLISIRKNLPCLRRGDFKCLVAEDNIYAFTRSLEGEKVFTIINASSKKITYNLSATQIGWKQDKLIRNLISQEVFPFKEGVAPISIDPWGGLLLS